MNGAEEILEFFGVIIIIFQLLILC